MGFHVSLGECTGYSKSKLRISSGNLQRNENSFDTSLLTPISPYNGESTGKENGKCNANGDYVGVYRD